MSAQALMDLDQRRLDAFAARLDSGRPPGWKIDGFVTYRRIPLPAIWYYEGCSRTADGPVSDHVRTSLVVWYATGATVVWEDKEWFPGRPARLRRLADTGY
jgi:hypothetical protein